MLSQQLCVLYLSDYSLISLIVIVKIFHFVIAAFPCDESMCICPFACSQWSCVLPPEVERGHLVFFPDSIGLSFSIM